MGARKWSNDRIEQLRAEWAKGLSVAAIAQRLGITRSAVTGKIKRLGLNKHAHSKSPSLPPPKRRPIRAGDDHEERP